jgi:hypothetical protein
MNDLVTPLPAQAFRGNGEHARAGRLADLVPAPVADDLPPGLAGAEPAALADWLVSAEGLRRPAVRAWVGFLAVHYAAFRSIRAVMAGANAGREDRKDNMTTATSAEEMLALANHLYLLRSRGVRGHVLECGCFKGYSSSCLSLVCRRLGFPFVVADSFAGLPPDPAEVGADKYYQVGDFAGSRAEVEGNIRAYGDIAGVEFLQGWFSDTLTGWDRPLALIWMDVDLVSSLEDVMKPCAGYLDPRGVVYSHDFLAGHVSGGKIVGPYGLPIGHHLARRDPDYRAAFVWHNVAVAGRSTAVGMAGHEVLERFVWHSPAFTALTRA